MTHYRMSDSMPSAIILARNPRSSSLDELKTYTGNHIFLNNSDEFQIKLFNPLKEKIGVQIGFNGKLSNSLLVLNPGEDVIVDRFLDDKRKMLFETYKYDKGNAAAVNAVANNGIVEIRFFKEYVLPLFSTSSAASGTIFIDNSPFYGTCNTTTINGSNASYSTLTNTGGMGTISTNNINGVFTAFDVNNHNSINYDQNVFLSQSKDLSLDFVEKKVKSKSKSKGLSETGRIEKGKKSDQDFKQVEIQFEHYPFHVITYNLKPVSEKDSYVHHEIREYCTKCGYRLRNSNWSFCPKCGTGL